MIRAEVRYSSGKFSHLKVTGHGGEEKGKDIYCAGVSACLIGALNALTSAENYSLKIESGDSEVTCLKPSTAHDEIVLETLVMQLKTLADNYPEHVNLIVSGKEG